MNIMDQKIIILVLKILNMGLRLFLNYINKKMNFIYNFYIMVKDMVFVQITMKKIAIYICF